MRVLPRLLICCLLPIMLGQCRTVKACLKFLNVHPSRGHDASLHGTAPQNELTLDEFIAANSHRNLSRDVLQVRFRAADANKDGLLTTREIREHQIRAAENKRRRKAQERAG